MEINNTKPYLFLGVLLLLISCEEFIEEDDISDESVVLIAPGDGANIQSSDVFFSWDEISGASEYRFQIAKPNFQNIDALLADSLVTGNSYHYEISTNGEFEWRVKGINFAYETAYSNRNFESTNIVEEVDISDEDINLLTPGESVVITQESVNFSWESIDNSDSYRLQVVTPNFEEAETLILDTVVEDTSLDVEIDETGDYEWRVKAQNSVYETEFFSSSFEVNLE